MLNKIYSLYDKKAEHFATPMFLLNDEVARRVLQDAIAKQETLQYHPDDYSLYVIGTWDDSSATLLAGLKDSNPNPVLVCEVKDIVEAMKQEA